ncbi:type II secretion system F family protein [Streptomyces sp. NPDC004065]|uniref:type II secretion system F family protein n=1 Tax=Streptomyces sp. NPDC004065 TaxID=3364689 RepID=UPI00384BA21F
MSYESSLTAVALGVRSAGGAWPGPEADPVPTAVAVLCAGAAVWLFGGRRPGARRARLLFAGGAAVATGPPARVWTLSELARLRRRLRPEWWAPAAGLVLAVLGASVLPVAAGAAAVPLLRRTRLARAARRARERRADAVIALCGALTGEVRAGRQPAEALLRAARDSGGLGDAQAAVLAAARFGGDVPGALAAAARQPGAEGLRGLAACWRVAVDQGAGLTAGLDRLEGALRAERDQRAELRAQLAGARATALMLAGLPALGLLLGTAMGADPLRVLLHTTAGLGCLLVGGALEAAGLWWALRIVRRAESA